MSNIVKKLLAHVNNFWLFLYIVPFYFVRFPNGLYGTFEIYAQSSGRIMFQALINPNPDSRNLEYEYEKQINKNQRNDCYWQF